MKYLGIVDGTMGILSRKMALTGPNAPAQALMPGVQKHETIGITEENTLESDVVRSPQLKATNVSHPISKAEKSIYSPVLGGKNYSAIVAKSRRQPTEFYEDHTAGQSERQIEPPEF